MTGIPAILLRRTMRHAAAGLFLIFTAIVAPADQCVYFDEQAASLVRDRIRTGDILLNYCEPCNMPEPLPLRIGALQIEKAEAAPAPTTMEVHGYRYTREEIRYGRVPGLSEEERKLLLQALGAENQVQYQLTINHEIQDLAYLYYATGSDNYENIGMMVGCAQGVLKNITYNFPARSDTTARPDSPYFADITGQCFDGSCLLKEWKIRKRATLLADHSVAAAPVTTVAFGDSVKVDKILSELQPVRAVVVFDQGRFMKGDEFFILNSLGEGFFRIWHNGRVVAEELLGVSMQQVENGEWAKCPEPDVNCWAEAEGYPEEMWWALVSTRDNKQGWLRDPSSYAENIFKPQ